MSADKPNKSVFTLKFPLWVIVDQRKRFAVGACIRG